MAGVDNFVTCAVCLELFKFPRRLPCYHIYCLKCLQSLVKPKTDYIKCPECRQIHVIPNRRVEEFKVDGRMEQLIEKLAKQKHESGVNVKHYPVISECEQAQLLETLTQESRQFQKDFFNENQLKTRQKLKFTLISHQENLGTLKLKVVTEIDDMIQELDKRKRSLLAGIEKEEKLILDHLSKLDQADANCVRHETLMTDLVYKVSPTKNVISFLRDHLSEQIELMTSVRDLPRNIDLRITNVKFKGDDELKQMIQCYGELISDIDYQTDFKLLTTLDGSECGAVFNDLWGLTVCPFTDNVYVIDMSSIRVYNNEGVYVRHLATNIVPCGVAFDSNQGVIVLCPIEHRVTIYNRDLQLINCFGSYGDENGQFIKPIAVACDVDNNIYVVDSSKKCIMAFSSDGTFTTEIGRDVLQGPVFVQLNQRQELLVSDKINDQVLIFNRDGQHLRSFPGDRDYNTLCRPLGICVDGRGHILVADSGNQMIRVYNDDGTHHSNIREPAAAMTKMFGLAVTSSGVIFITDCDENKLHMIVNTRDTHISVS